MLRLCFILFSFFLLFSCAKPTDPESLSSGKTSGGYKIVSRITTSGYAQDVLIKDTLAYIAQGEGGLQIVNISNPEEPKTVSTTFEGARGYSVKIAMKDTAVYLAAGTFGVTVIDVGNPKQPEVTAANLEMKPARNFLVLGDYLLTSISEQGVKISEISYPTQPDIRGGIITPGYARGMTTTPDSSFLLVACGEMGLAIFDISDMQSGFGVYPLIGWSDTPGYAEDVVLMNNEPYALLACGTAGLQIIDFSDTTNIHITGSYNTGGYAKEIQFHNQRIYLTTETRGLQVFSVDANTPELVGTVNTEFALGLAVEESYVYIADETEGLIIVEIPAY